MGKLKAQGKPFDISKREVWEAFQEVEKNRVPPEWMESPSRSSSPICGTICLRSGVRPAGREERL
jgi:hypothetical protein